MDNKIFILQFVILTGGVANLALPTLTTYSQLVGFAILTGVSESFLSIMSIIPQHLLGADKSVNAFGVMAACASIISTLGGPAAGFLPFGAYTDR